MELTIVVYPSHLEMINTSGQALWFPFFSYELEISGNWEAQNLGRMKANPLEGSKEGQVICRERQVKVRTGHWCWGQVCWMGNALGSVGNCPSPVRV